MDLNIPPIPITKTKISYNDWLNLPIKYEDNYFLKDLLFEISQKTYYWISNQDDLNNITDFNQFHKNFLIMMYDKYF